MKYIIRFFKWFISLFRKQVNSAAIRYSAIEETRINPTACKRHAWVEINGIRIRKPSFALKEDL